MYKILSSIFVFIISVALYAQPSKKIIDSTALFNWVLPDNQTASISNDGKFVSYTIFNEYTKSKTLFIQSTERAWKKKYPGASSGFFSEDSRQFIFIKQDTLFFLELASGKNNYILNVVSYKRPRSNPDILFYQLNNSEKAVTVHHLPTGKKKDVLNVLDWTIDDMGNSLVCKTQIRDGDKLQTNLEWINVKEFNSKIIWKLNDLSKTELSNYALDNNGGQLVFSIQENRNDTVLNSIWYYKWNFQKPILKAGGSANGIYGNMTIASSISFTNDGRYIYLDLVEPILRKESSNSMNLNLWSHKDTFLQSVQLHGYSRHIGYKTCKAVIYVDSNKLVQLERNMPYDKIILYPTNGDFAIIRNDTEGDRFWLRNSTISYSLVSYLDGTRKTLPVSGAFSVYFAFSPSGRNLIYFHPQKKEYYSYDIKAGTSKMISGSVPKNYLTSKYSGHDVLLTVPFNPISFTRNEEAIIVYDYYDIWLLDVNGIDPAVNLTNGFGRKNKIVLRFFKGFEDYDFNNSTYDTTYLIAYNTENKYNGFYKIGSKGKDPTLSFMGPFLFCFGKNVLSMNEMLSQVNLGMRPLKAKNANRWLVMRQSFNECPNFYVSGDLAHFKPITDLYPHKEFNWLSAELLTFKQLDSTVSQGILYKPEDFDPKKSYPVIINFYQALTHRLYTYPTPGFTRSNIDIAWFTSREYLVFTPDIYHNANRNNGESALNTIEAAGLFLRRLPFVAGNKMATIGHSEGGGKNNYIITHSHQFAASITGAGVSNKISAAFQLNGAPDQPRNSRLGQAERFEGESLWKNPVEWFNESSIVRADKITSPLLIMHNWKDGAVPWWQGVEMFVALRRLQKPCWMLQYDGAGHVLDGINSIDFTLRVEQFLDHYLKGALPPRWMTSGIPAKLKGVESGYELDPVGACGSVTCPVCNKIK